MRNYRLQQNFITPHCLQQNAMAESVIRTLEDQCMHRDRLESQVQAARVIANCITFSTAHSCPTKH